MYLLFIQESLGQYFSIGDDVLLTRIVREAVERLIRASKTGSVHVIEKIIDNELPNVNYRGSVIKKSILYKRICLYNLNILCNDLLFCVGRI